MKYKDKYLQEKDDKEYAQQSFENIRKQNVELLEQIERLQEQLDIVKEQRNDIHIDKQVLQKQLHEANEVIKHYANDENWYDYYDDDDEKMTKSLYIDCNGTLKASLYLEKWGVK